MRLDDGETVAFGRAPPRHRRRPRCGCHPGSRPSARPLPAHASPTAGRSSSGRGEGQARGGPRRELHRPRGRRLAARARARGARRGAGAAPAGARPRARSSATSSARLHEEHGVVFHLGQKASAIDAGGVTLEDGGTARRPTSSWSGIGVRPDSSWPRRPGSTSTAACWWTSGSRRALPGSTPRATSRAGRIPTPASASASSTGWSPSVRGRRRRATCWAQQRAVSSRPVLLEPALRRAHQLRGARGELGLDRGRGEHRGQGLRRAICAWWSRPCGCHDLSRPRAWRPRSRWNGRQRDPPHCHPERSGGA